MKEAFDVVIVGGGMVGLTIACALGGSHLRVGVLENEQPADFCPQQTHDLRVSALSIASKNILDRVGAWQGIETKRLCPFKRMRVWEDEGDTLFCSDDIGYDVLGYIVENRITQLALLERLSFFANVELICPVAINCFDYDPVQGSVLTLNNGRQLQATLVIAADGGQSNIRQSVGLGVTSWDYAQHALVIYIETVYGQQDITWQRFVSSGPQAFLPLNGSFASLVWYHHPDEVRRLRALSNEELKQALQAAFPDCLGEVKQVIGTSQFALKRQHAHRYVKQGIALAGDAAHIINPLAGQGVNIGLLDAAALAEVILQASVQGRCIGDVSVLRHYEALRKVENLKMMTVMDVFYQAFSQEWAGLKWLRNVGLGVAQHIVPIKHKTMRYAMGLEGNLPKLAKGESIL